jgi:hypothetical protein
MYKLPFKKTVLYLLICLGHIGSMPPKTGGPIPTQNGPQPGHSGPQGDNQFGMNR